MIISPKILLKYLDLEYNTGEEGFWQMYVQISLKNIYIDRFLVVLFIKSSLLFWIVILFIKNLSHKSPFFKWNIKPVCVWLDNRSKQIIMKYAVLSTSIADAINVYIILLLLQIV